MHLLTIIIFFLTHAIASLNQPKETARLELNIAHHFGTSDLKMDQEYPVSGGNKITLTKFKYYFSHLELIGSDGSIWKAKEIYHLIDINEETASTYKIILSDVPVGNYKQLSFSIGVDSVANHSGDQAGVLDPDYGMFWMWETGYTFFKIEGFHKDADQRSRALVCHVGRDNCLRNVKLNIPPKHSKIPATTLLNIEADINKVFGGFNGAAINLLAGTSQSSISIMGGDKAFKVADNFSTVFSMTD